MKPNVESAQSGVDSGSGAVRPAVPPRCCLLEIGQELLAIDLYHVREVFKVESITPVPGMPSVLVGVANLRGTVIPMVDLRVFMGMPCSSKSQYAVVVGQGGGQVGILIDEVPEIRVPDSGELLEAVCHESVNNHPFLSGRVHVDGRPGGLVELSKLLAVLESTNDQHGHGLMINGNGVDTDRGTVISEGRLTTSDGEDNDHGEAW